MKPCVILLHCSSSQGTPSIANHCASVAFNEPNEMACNLCRVRRKAAVWRTLLLVGLLLFTWGGTRRTKSTMTDSSFRDEYASRLVKEHYASTVYNLASRYRDTNDTPQDYYRARLCYELAAGHCYCNLAAKQRDDNTIQPRSSLRRWTLLCQVKYDEARHCYELAADKGLAVAQFNLGHLYDNGNCVEQDYDKARYENNLAADQGLDAAHFNLSHLYDIGRCVEQDTTRQGITTN